MPQFNRPVNTIAAREKFGVREVGLNHPDNDAFIRISDDGMIELMSRPGLGVVIDPKTGTIHFFSDSVRIHTRDQDGLRWNRLSFNNRSTKYTEPTFVEYQAYDIKGLYDGTENFLLGTTDISRGAFRPEDS